MLKFQSESLDISQMSETPNVPSGDQGLGFFKQIIVFKIDFASIGRNADNARPSLFGIEN